MTGSAIPVKNRRMAFLASTYKVVSYGKRQSPCFACVKDLWYLLLHEQLLDKMEFNKILFSLR